MQAETQGIPGKDLHVADMRDMPFCEIEVATGRPPDIRVQFNNTTGAGNCPPDKFDAIDARRLADQLRADRVVLNPRRHWMMDQAWLYNIGNTHDFDGVMATWMGSAALQDFLAAAGKPYTPFQTSRASKYLYEKGKPVYLLIPPGGSGVYVMQSYTDHVEKGLTAAQLPDLGRTLTLPAGWTYQVKTLGQDLTVAPPPPGYTAHSLVDNFLNVYAGCGFDTACSYVP
jgi:hypothetical protein